MLPKPGKKTLAAAKNWRPIALLSGVGKGVDRLAARRTEWLAEREGLLGPRQAGAAVGRSAVDVLIGAVSEIQTLKTRNFKTCLVKADVGKAFPSTKRDHVVETVR